MLAGGILRSSPCFILFNLLVDLQSDTRKAGFILGSPTNYSDFATYGVTKIRHEPFPNGLAHNTYNETENLHPILHGFAYIVSTVARAPLLFSMDLLTRSELLLMTTYATAFIWWILCSF